MSATTNIPLNKNLEKENKLGTSNGQANNGQIDTQAFERAASSYPWQNIGSFNEGKKFDRSFITDSQLIKTYIIETFHADWYYNTGLVIGTCFFSWLIARLRFGIFGLVFVLLGTASVYRAEFRRFKRNVKDDIQRIASAERLEKNFESMEWLNSFLKKFWVIYMPALSDTVKTQTNAVLKDLAPGFGIEKLSLDEFTLGSKAPTINSIKSYTKKGADVVEWDWAFSFTPNDTSDMTKREIDKRINPKVALGVTVGKAFVSKSLPILVEDMSVSGRVKITLKLSLNFPHIKIVSVSLLEPPKIDFSLKPVGGDTLGLDIMTFIPGLSTLITTLINSNAGPMLYAPNHLDIDVEELMAAQSNDAIGVVALTVKGANDLKETVNPYIQVHTDAEPAKHIRTDIKAQTTDPLWNETKYILVSNLQQKLNIDLYNFDTKKKKGVLYGSHDFDLNELLQKDSHLNLSKPLLSAGKKKGAVNYDVRWFPVLNESNVVQTEDIGDEVNAIDSEVGIFKFKLHQAKHLDNTVSLTGMLNPKAELFIDDKLVQTFRTLKRSNEPSWEESFEVLVTQKSSTHVKLVITDTGSRQEILGTLSENLDALVFNVSNGDDVFQLSPQGEVRITATWNPVSLSGVDSAINYVPPIGVARLHLREARDLINLETVGNVDPYVKVLLNNKGRYVSSFHPGTTEPKFNEVIFLPITSETEHVTLELWDDQNLGKDRQLGSTNFSISDFIKKNADGSLLFNDGSNKILTSKLARRNKNPKGEISYSVSFLPVIPVYSITELEELEQKEEQLEAKKIEQAKELEKWEETYKKNPKDYEWVEIEDKDAEAADLAKKEKLSLGELLTYRSGTLGIHILGGTVKKSDSYFQVLFDDFAHPAFTSTRTNGRQINPEVGDSFIRDLPNSNIIFRTTKKAIVKDSDQIIDEVSHKTIDLLQKGFAEPTTIHIGPAQVQIRFEYIPSAIKLPPSETILDTGIARIDLLDAEDLASADSNGKSDPFVTLSIADTELFKSSVVKKTLAPTWNESTTVPIISRSRPNVEIKIWDWDRAGKNELIGTAILDISNVKPDTSEYVNFQLQPQGTLRTRVVFQPQYNRPKVGASEFGANLAALAGMPLKGVGAAANLATGVVGGGVGAATGLISGTANKGGSLFKSVLGGKKSRQSTDEPRASSDNYGNDVNSLRSGKSKQQVNEFQPPPKVSNNGSNAGSPLASPNPNSHSRTTSTASSFTGALKGRNSTKGLLIIRSGNNLGSHAQLKVSLAIDGKLKEIYRTKNAKSSNDIIRWDEELSFDAPEDAEVVIGGIVHHKFSKDKELGNAYVKLHEVIDSPRDIDLQLGQGTVVVSFQYSPQPQEGQEDQNGNGNLSGF